MASHMVQERRKGYWDVSKLPEEGTNSTFKVEQSLIFSVTDIVWRSLLIPQFPNSATIYGLI